MLIHESETVGPSEAAVGAIAPVNTKVLLLCDVGLGDVSPDAEYSLR
jgi:hypothetical protein